MPINLPQYMKWLCFLRSDRNPGYCMIFARPVQQIPAFIIHFDILRVIYGSRERINKRDRWTNSNGERKFLFKSHGNSKIYVYIYICVCVLLNSGCRLVVCYALLAFCFYFPYNSCLISEGWNSIICLQIYLFYNISSKNNEHYKYYFNKF